MLHLQIMRNFAVACSFRGGRTACTGSAEGTGSSVRPAQVHQCQTGLFLAIWEPKPHHLGLNCISPHDHVGRHIPNLVSPKPSFWQIPQRFQVGAYGFYNQNLQSKKQFWGLQRIYEWLSFPPRKPRCWISPHASTASRSLQRW